LLKEKECILTHSPALASRRGIGKYPPLSAPFRPGSSSPRGEAVMEKEAFGHHIGVPGSSAKQAGRLTSRARVQPAGSTRTGESSLPAVITTRRTRTSGAKAANEDAGRVRRRSEAFECPGEPPGGRPLAASEREQWGSPKGRRMLLLLLSHRVATI